MDLIKIGKYIAAKRKERGWTQRELAEKLGMSDKSVSKWERGICLPDVSIYADLCSLLGIKINEFLAGEDISEENIIRKSEENIIGVASDSKRRQRRLKILIYILLAISIITISFIAVIQLRASKLRNVLIPLDRDSVEMKTAELLSGIDGVFIYKYIATDDFASLSIYVSEYHSGKLVNKEKVLGLGYEDIASPKGGTILVVPDFDNFSVKVIVADDSTKFSTGIPILEDIDEREFWGRSATQIDENTAIKYNEEQGLVALIYGKDQISVGDIQVYEDGFDSSMNDCVYYFSFQFDK